MTAVQAGDPVGATPVRSDAAIEVRGLKKAFGEVEVLQGVDLVVGRGTLTALLGPNGAGKSTFVRILSTLTRPDSGTVLVNGVDVLAQPAQARQVIGLTSQDAAVDGILTGRENLVMMARLFRLQRAAAVRRAQELLELFDLVEAADRPARTYSGGMRRKLDLAVSLITSPPVLFLDEPTTGLDPRSRQAMWETIRALLASGTTILLTTQTLDEADELADRIVVIDGGKVVAEGSPNELKQRVGTERLSLELATEAEADQARALLGGVPVQQRGLSVPVPHPGQVRLLLNRLAEAGLEPTAVALQRPTLDDVFLTFTNRPAGGDR